MKTGILATFFSGQHFLFKEFPRTTEGSIHTFETEPAIETMVEIGTLDNVLNRSVQKEAIDLIIMGTKDKHNTFEKLLGSHSSSTVVNAPCHILVIPERAVLTHIETVAYASDLSSADPFHIWELGKLLEVFHPSAATNFKLWMKQLSTF